ncbi:HAD family phosphatase [Roseobacter sp. HKCCA0434]|uniref:HAD family hydrolase n=1 Tax=Roseobacter sp. HKCCA0434 TaxID=3079297 RepID=UPI0029058D08|nr:HAD family phosphatase [Roseobacter sp. HKCCA0434]
MRIDTRRPGWLDAVIFDCDGVLVDSEPITTRAIRDNLAARGVAWSVADIERNFLGGTLAGIGEAAVRAGARLEPDWLDRTYEELFAVLEREVEAMPRADTLLEWCGREGIAVAVGSNGPVRKMEVTLRRTGLERYFQGRVVSRENVARPKPAPDVYLEALARTGAIADRAVVVEDSATGARAAAAAGIACVMIGVGDFDGPSVTCLADLPQVLVAMR